MTTHNIVDQFRKWDGDRQDHLELVRECARLTIPSVLPDPSRLKGPRVPKNFQSDGARFVSGLAGKLLQAIFPPGVPYVADQLAPEIELDPNVPEQWKMALTERLSLRNMIVVAALESQPSYWTNKRTVMKQLIVAGDTCERLNDDFSTTVFRLDNFVTLRDSSGAVLSQIVREQIDVATLTDDELATGKINSAGFKSRRIENRLVDKYTRNEWNPWSKTWVQTRAVVIEGKCHNIGEAEDKVSAFWNTCFDLTNGDHYAEGLCALNFGDLTSMDEFSHRIINFAELASWFKIFVDRGSDFDTEELDEENGTYHQGDVRAGVLQDLTLFKADKVADFTIVRESLTDIKQSVGKSFLSETGSVRDSERTTLGEVTKTTISEMTNALGGVYAPLASNQQLPQFERAKHQLVTDGKMDPLPKRLQGRAVRTVTLTGLSALAAHARFQNIVSFNDLLKQNDKTAAWINDEVFVRTAARYLSINEPGLILTKEQYEARIDEALKRQAQAQGAQQAIQSAGAIAETAAANATAAQ